MVFASRSANYTVCVGGGTQTIGTDRNGSLFVSSDGENNANFKTGIFTPDEMRQASVAFRDKQALPYQQDGLIDMREAHAVGELSAAYEGWVPAVGYSKFDTGDPAMCPAELREEYEAKLQTVCEDGSQWVVRLDDVIIPAPWANYPAPSEGRAEDIVTVALAMGGSALEDALAYEQATDSNQGVTRALQTAIRARDVRREESEELTVKV